MSAPVEAAPEKEASAVEKFESNDVTETQLASVPLFAKMRSRVSNPRLVWHIFVGCFFTGWWLSIVIQDKHRAQWLIPTCFWGIIMLRLISWHTPILKWAFRQIAGAWNYGADLVYTKLIPNHNHRLMAGAAVTIAVMLVGTFVPTETSYSKRKDRVVSFAGILVCIFAGYLTSKNRSKINWNSVIGGMLMQFIIAIFVLRTEAGYDFFNFISTLARELLGFAKDGVAFLTNTEVSQLGMFFFTVVPGVAFFVAFVHIWYYYGLIQWGIGKFSKVFFWALRISGAEAVTASASPFLGIGESAILIKDLIPYLTQAELHQVMTSGFATISGAVLVGYIGLGLNAQVLVSSCVMSIPASVAISKLRFPETEQTLTSGTADIPELKERDDDAQNVLQAFSDGATLGLKCAATMTVQCLCIIALVALLNGVLTWFGKFWNIGELTLELIGGYIFYPITFFLGVPRDEILHVARLISYKFIQNEYVAYDLMVSSAPYNEMSPRGTLIATYALCGFANFGSLGITLGILNAISNHSRAKDISKNIMLALICGCISTLTSAAIAGMVMHDLEGF